MDNPSEKRERTGKPGRPSVSSRLPTTDQPARKRRPLSAPMRKMELPPIPGYHVHWINDYPGRVEQAQDGGYEFVDRSEVVMNDRGPTPTDSDLGTRVSMVVGRNEDGTPLRAYAMKIKQEWYDEDQATIQAHNDRIDKTIRRGQQQVEGEKTEDARQRYVKTSDFRTNFATRRG